jgi:Molecular chaperone (small heat shock protein)
MMDEFMKNAGEHGKEILTFLYPPVRMYEDNGELVIEADLPGFQKKEIKVVANKFSMEISASRKTQKDLNLYMDQRPDNVRKTIRLPVELDTDKQHVAKYADGVLTIRAAIKGLTTLKVE